MDAIPPAATPSSTSGSAAAPADETALFDQMVRGVLTTGMSLISSVVSDLSAELAEPDGDPNA